MPFHYRSEVLQTTTKRTYHSLTSRAYAQSSLIEPIHSDLRSVIFIHLLAGNLGLSAWHKLNTSNTSELSQLSRICTKKKQGLKLLSKIYQYQKHLVVTIVCTQSKPFFDLENSVLVRNLVRNSVINRLWIAVKAIFNALGNIWNTYLGFRTWKLGWLMGHLSGNEASWAIYNQSDGITLLAFSQIWGTFQWDDPDLGSMIRDHSDHEH